MFCKYNIIIFLVNISFIFSQAYFNRIIGDDIFISDARSMGIGNTYLTTGSSSSIIYINIIWVLRIRLSSVGVRFSKVGLAVYLPS